MTQKSALISCLLIALCTLSTNAQSGMSSLSVGAFRAGILLHSADIHVDEFINYHRHELPLPSDDQRIALDARWKQLPNGKTIFQIGLATPRDIDPNHRRPLNLVLVIDCSGSMSGDRIENVKKALLSFTERLRDKDSVTIVSYSTEASIALPACIKTSNTKIAKSIRGLTAKGSTNLHGGLMLGYQQAKLNFDPQKANRVLLLTDGIANVGTTDPETIAKDSKQFNRQGIDLSIIGLGHDLNQNLLRSLAISGRGAIHFVGDAQDIHKTFVAELDSLLSPAADQVSLILESPTDHRPSRIYGHSLAPASRTKLKLGDMSHGATQMIIGEFKHSRDLPEMKLTLRYTDSLTGKRITQKTTLVFNEERQCTTREFQKNYVIARLAFSLKQSAKLSETNDTVKARKKLRKVLEFAHRNFEKGSDPDIDRVVEITTKQHARLDKSLARK